MKKSKNVYRFVFTAHVDIEAENEDKAYRKFEEMDLNKEMEYRDLEEVVKMPD
jgi:hypothetical protein